MEWLWSALSGALLIGGVIWIFRHAGRERRHYLGALGYGALTGGAVVALFAFPMLLRAGAGSTHPVILACLTRLFIIAPLGALIALILALVSETGRPGTAG